MLFRKADGVMMWAVVDINNVLEASEPEWHTTCPSLDVLQYATAQQLANAIGAFNVKLQAKGNRPELMNMLMKCWNGEDVTAVEGIKVKEDTVLQLLKKLANLGIDEMLNEKTGRMVVLSTKTPKATLQDLLAAAQAGEEDAHSDPSPLSATDRRHCSCRYGDPSSSSSIR